MKKFSDFICRKRNLILIISGILLFFSFIGSMMTHINYDILVYLPSDNETIKGENILSNDFNIGSYSIAVIEDMSSKEILKLENEIKGISGVNAVISIYDVLGNTIDVDMLPSEVQDKLHKDGTDILFITFSDGISSDVTLDAVSEIRSLASGKVKFGGMSSLVLDTMDLSNKEIAIYIIIAAVLCLLVLELALDSYLVPILLLGNIGFAILFNLGTNIFLGEISYITKALVAVLQLGVTTDFSIFLYHAYEKNKKSSKSSKEAMSKAIRETFTSVTGSSLTTIAGFLVLCTMQLTLGSDLGIVMAKGVFLGVLSVLTLFPSLLLVMDKWIEKTRHKVVLPKISKLNEFIVNKSKIIFVIFLLILYPAYLANKNVDIYYKIDDSLPDYLESKTANLELKEKYNIVSPEIILLDKNIKPDEVNSLIEEIEKIEGIDFALSLSSLKSNGFDTSMISGDLLENDKYQLILLNSLYDIASDELNSQIVEVQKLVKNYDKNAIVAGEGPLMKDMITISDRDFNNVNYSSIICIMVILLFVLKSLSLPILLISAIELSIFVNMGIAYFGGTTLPFVAPIVIGTIQLGATIDYAILITTNYLEKRRKGIKPREAMLETLNYTGNSILVSGLCLFAATCGVSFVSKLEMVASICTLLSRGAIISMVVVITILPSILLMFDGLIMRSTYFKERNLKKMKIKKVIGFVLIVSLFLGSSNVYALSKDETVMTKLEYNGEVKKSLVNERLINDSKLAKIDDYTILENVMNINNDESFSKDGNKLSWNANGKDIFYQGSTNKSLPLEVSINYMLDGKSMSIDDMMGKSGKVTIELLFKNKDKHSVSINGSSVLMYTPFIVSAGTIIDGSSNSHVSVNNGKVINNGNKNIVLGFATPGLEASLNLNSARFSEKIVLSYETEKFELSSIYIVATPNLIKSNDLGILNELNGLYKSMDLLKSNMSTIEKGSKDLKVGSNELKGKLGSSIKGISSSRGNALSDAQVEGIRNMATDFVKSMFTDEYKKALKDMAWEQVKVELDPNDPKVQEIVTNVVTSSVEEEVKKYIISLQSYGINFDLSSCTSPTPDVLPMCLGVNSIKESAANSAKATASKVAVYVAENISKNVAVSVAEKSALETASLVSANVASSVADQVKNTSLDSISSSLNALYKGVESLDNGIGSLSSGITKFKTEGINKLSDTVNGKVKNTSDRMEALVELGENYQFAGSKKVSDSETKFVMIIDGKSLPKENTVETKVKEKTSFIDKIKNLFK